jgi:hypothetical protein
MTQFFEPAQDQQACPGIVSGVPGFQCSFSPAGFKEMTEVPVHATTFHARPRHDRIQRHGSAETAARPRFVIAAALFIAIID